MLCRPPLVVLRLFCFVFLFCLFLSLKPRPFVKSFFDMHAPRQPHVFLPFSLFFEDVALSEYFCTITVFSLVWRVLLLLPSYAIPFRVVFFYLVTTDWIFYIACMRIQSINQFSKCYRQKKKKTSIRKDGVNVRFTRKHLEREKAGVNRQYQQQFHYEYDMALTNKK